MVLFARAKASNAATKTALLAQIAQSVDPELQLLVAQNPSTPVAALEKLSRSESPATRSAVASNLQTPAPTLDVLSTDLDLQVRIAVAHNPNSPSGALTKIAESRRVTPDELLAIAGSESATEEVLEALSDHKWMKIRKAVARNRKANVRTRAKLLDDPAIRSLVKRTDYLLAPAQRVALATAFGASQARKVLSHDRDVEVRRAVVFSASATELFDLRHLAKDPDSQVAAIARALTTSDETLLRALAESEDQRVLRKLFDHSASPSDLKRSIAERLDWAMDENLAARIAASPEATGAVLEKLAKHPAPRVRELVARNPGATVNIAQVLAGDAEGSVRALAISRGDLPKTILESLSNDPDPRVAGEVAGSPHISEDTLTRLALSQNEYVRRRAVTNPRIPAAILTRLARSHVPLPRPQDPQRATQLEIVSAIARNPRTDPDSLLSLAKDQALALAIAGNPSSPAPALELAVDHLLSRVKALRSALSGKGQFSGRPRADPEWGAVVDALRTIAVSPMVPQGVLQKLSDVNWCQPTYSQRRISAPMDEGGSFTVWKLDVAETNAAWQAERAKMMPRLRQMQWEQVVTEDERLAFAKLPDIPAELTAALLPDPDPKMRAELAENESVAAAHFLELAQDPDVMVRRAAARNLRWGSNEPDVQTARVRLSRDRDLSVRTALFDNPRVSLDLIALGIFESGVRDADPALSLAVMERFVGTWRYERNQNEISGARSFQGWDPAYSVEARYTQDRYSRLPLDALEFIVDNGGRVVREMLFESEKTPGDILVRIINAVDPSDGQGIDLLMSQATKRGRNRKNEHEVWRTFASHKASSETVLAQLAPATSDEQTLECIAGNPNATDELLMELARSPRPEAVHAVARSGRLDLLEQVAENTSTPVSLLLQLAERQEATLDAKLLQNPSLPEDLFIELMSRSRNQAH